MHLGLDLGTSELKAVLLDENHRVRAQARAPLAVQRPRLDWSEQEPAAWWAALEKVMSTLQQQHASLMAAVRAVGLSGQMHGAVLLDERQAVLRPAILWNDGRSIAQCETLLRREPRLTTLAGNLAMPGFTAPKLLWVQEHEPDIRARTATVLLPKDYLRLRLTGDLVSEMSDASGTLWLDVARRCWSSALLAAGGLAPSHMPRLVEGSEASSSLHGVLARRWGMRDDVVVAGGGGDNAASAVGMGCVNAGQGFVSLGTSGVIFVAGSHFAPNPAKALHAFCHALPGRWHQMSVMLSAASAIDWAARVWGWQDASALLNEAAQCTTTQRAHAPTFLPYLSGERSPINRADARATMHGLSHQHSRVDVAYAVVEGVSFGLRDGWSSFDSTADVCELVAVGGGSRSHAWLQLLSNVLEVPLTLRRGSDVAAAVGAARLAWLSVGASIEDVCLLPPLEARIEPDAAATSSLHERFARYTQAQQRLWH